MNKSDRQLYKLFGVYVDNGEYKRVIDKTDREFLEELERQFDKCNEEYYKPTLENMLEIIEEWKIVNDRKFVDEDDD